MNAIDFFGTLQWWHVPITLLSLAFSVCVLRLVLTLNINELFRDRDERRDKRLRALCTHTILSPAAGNIRYESLAWSPSGTIQAQCTRCGMVFIGGLQQAAEVGTAWAHNPLAWSKQEQKFQKLLKRSGYR